MSTAPVKGSELSLEASGQSQEDEAARKANAAVQARIGKLGVDDASSKTGRKFFADLSVKTISGNGCIVVIATVVGAAIGCLVGYLVVPQYAGIVPGAAGGAIVGFGAGLMLSYNKFGDLYSQWKANQTKATLTAFIRVFYEDENLRKLFLQSGRPVKEDLKRLNEKVEESAKQYEDGVSLTALVTPTQLIPCGHIYNEDTVMDLIREKANCPECREPIQTYETSVTTVVQMAAELDRVVRTANLSPEVKKGLEAFLMDIHHIIHDFYVQERKALLQENLNNERYEYLVSALHNTLYPRSNNETSYNRRMTIAAQAGREEKAG